MFNFSKADIESLYIGKNLKRKEVADILGVSKWTVIKFLNENNILKRKNPEDFPKLNEMQMDLIVGSLLGDASCCTTVTRPNNNANFTKTQSKIPRGKIQGQEYLNRYDYMKYHFDLMKEYSLNIYNRNKISPQGKLIPCYEFATKHHPVFTTIYKKWYKVVNGKNIKVIPNDIKLNSFIMSIWFCDDGINKYKDRAAVFCTDCFTMDENNFLLEVIFKDIGVKGHLCDDNRIHVTDKEGYLDLLTMMNKYIIWDCFKYKINTHFYKPVVISIAENHHNAKLTNDDVRNIVLFHNNGEKNIELAKKFNVSETTIGNILDSKVWKSLELNIDNDVSFNSSGVKGIYKTKNNKYYLKIKNKVFDTLEEAMNEKKA